MYILEMGRLFELNDTELFFYHCLFITTLNFLLKLSY